MAENVAPLCSVLFKDSDNLYITLKKLYGEKAAREFFQRPKEWLAWLETALPATTDGPRPAGRQRRLLIRKCFLNPDCFGAYRDVYVRSGFEVVDCPPTTRQGKTGADMEMAVQVLDALHHPTRFDEFILLSGDSDFLPVLRRLRAHDRRTVVLAVGPVAAAYQAACDRLLPIEELMEKALGFSPTARAPAVLGRMAAKETAPANFGPDGAVPVAPSAAIRPPDPAANGATGANGPAHAAPRPAADDLPARVVEVIRRLLAESLRPVPMAEVGNRVRRELGEDVINRSRWAGFETLGALLRALLRNTPDLGFALATKPPGYVYDPSRHAAPDDRAEAAPDDDFQRRCPVLAELARKVHAVGAPLLTPERYAALFGAVAAELAHGPFALTETSRRTRDRLEDAGTPVTRRDVSFVLKGLMFTHGEHALCAGIAPGRLAEWFCDNVLTLCRNHQIELAEGDPDRLRRWIVGAPPAPVAAAEAVPAPAVAEGSPPPGEEEVVLGGV